MKQFIKKIIVSIITLEARLVLRKYKPKIIAVTGNVGKTSTKDAIYSVLKNIYYVRKSEKSFNSEIGVPLTILGCDSGWNAPSLWMKNILEGLALIFLKNHYPKVLVVEVGADRPGYIEKIASWLKPDVAVITKIGDTPVHIEFFNSVAELVKEKEHLATSLNVDGLLVLNGDDENTLSLKQKSKTKTITFGKSGELDIFASHENILYKKDGKPEAINFKVNYGHNSLPITIKDTVGFQYVYAVLATLAVSIHEGVNFIRASQYMNDFVIPPGRFKLIEGISDSTIIDDTYNAAPAAMLAALGALAEIKTKGRRIAVIGDMMELGKFSAEEHKKVGKLAAKSCDFLVTVGMRSEEIGKVANKNKLLKKYILHFDSVEKAAEKLEKLIKADDVVLVKGAQAMRMEKIVEKIMLHPEEKQKYLVRQEKEWLAK